MLLMGLCVLSLATTYLVFFAQKNEVGDKPNFFIGYRTPTSMQSKKVWDFSQKEFKKIFIKTQFLLMFMGSIWIIYDVINFLNSSSIIIQALIYFLSVIVIITLTETKVKKFTKEQK